MLCRRSQTISKRSTPQPSLGPRARDWGKCVPHAKREKDKDKDKDKDEGNEKEEEREREGDERRWPAECRPDVSACRLQATFTWSWSWSRQHGHTRSRGVSGGLLSHFHSTLPLPVYPTESQVFVYLVQFVMEFEFENENGSRDLLTLRRLQLMFLRTSSYLHTDIHEGNMYVRSGI